MHHQEAGRNLPLTFEAALENDRAKCDGRVANVFVEQAAERSEALEADLKTDIGDC